MMKIMIPAEPAQFYIPAYLRLTLKDQLLPNHDLDGAFAEATLAFIGENFDDLNSFNLTTEQRTFIINFIIFFIEEDSYSLSWLNKFREKEIEKEISSKFEGVNFNKKSMKWTASLQINNKTIFGGFHDTIDGAVKARLKLVKAHS